ncbi:hypothetical protein BCU85_09285 [Vibrio lentus]|nr:hypothetical protein BCU85_09285 [Vibrio lentus]PMK94791.1 hypothetical protein BCT88_00525 [Vibrio lentus]PML24527.1 hypothetical protein BCT80_22225 [Vibrio lentus]PMM21758.1 hypothetical protein BCT57_11870 [Vibrio lentus]PMM46392.1 hypothetical protein BCT53_05435 [Vibrio lentus]
MLKKTRFICSNCGEMCNYEYLESTAEDLFITHVNTIPVFLVCEHCKQEQVCDVYSVQGNGYRLEFSLQPTLVTDDNRVYFQKSIEHKLQLIAQDKQCFHERREMIKIENDLVSILKEKEIQADKSIEKNTNIEPDSTSRKSSDLSSIFQFFAIFISLVVGVRTLVLYGLNWVVMVAILLIVAVLTFDKGFSNGIKRILIFIAVMLLFGLFLGDDNVSVQCWYRIGCTE